MFWRIAINVYCGGGRAVRCGIHDSAAMAAAASASSLRVVGRQCRAKWKNPQPCMNGCGRTLEGDWCVEYRLKLYSIKKTKDGLKIFISDRPQFRGNPERGLKIRNAKLRHIFDKDGITYKSIDEWWINKEMNKDIHIYTHINIYIYIERERWINR